MINKDVAEKLILDNTSNASKSLIINMIYDSIGSCKNCEFLGDRGIYCNKLSIYVPKNGYCWQVKKDTPCTTP